MEFALSQLAEWTGAKLLGDPNVRIARVRPFEDAGSGDIALVAEEKLRSLASSSDASAFIVDDARGLEGRNLLVHPRPKLVFARLLKQFAPVPIERPGVHPDFACGEGTHLGQDLVIHPRVIVGRDSWIGDRSTLHAGVVVGDRVRIGADTVIYPNVTVYSDVTIGSRTLIHAGTVIGADGFGFVTDEEGRQVKILQTGRVEIEDDVEIGANCCIDRATFGSTRIARGAKLDNLVQVAHNCVIGEDTVVAALTGFSGGTMVGRRAVIAGSVGTNPHVRIGDGALVMGQAGVTKDIPDGQRVAGTPAREEKLWKRAIALFYRLPEILERVQRLEHRVGGSQEGARELKERIRRQPSSGGTEGPPPK